MNLSKSRYTLGIRCPKLLWLSIYKPELAEDTGTDEVFENGNINTLFFILTNCITKLLKPSLSTYLDISLCSLIKSLIIVDDISL